MKQYIELLMKKDQTEFLYGFQFFKANDYNY